MMVRRHKMCFCLLMLLFITSTKASVRLEEKVGGRCYGLQGHLNIGYIMSVSNPEMSPNSSMYCEDEMKVRAMYYVSTVMYALKVLNANTDLLPNVTLGVVILDMCSLPMAALGRSIAIATEKKVEDEAGLPAVGTTHDCDGALRKFTVDAILGPSNSATALAVSQFLSLYEIPHLATTVTSDELSDKERFGYFLRLVPPDHFQARALVDIIHYFGWDYFMLLYSEGAYGENGAKNVEKYAKALDLCLAWSLRMSADLQDGDKEYILAKLHEFRNARAVILFMSSSAIRLLFSIISGTDLEGNFIWVASDYFSFSQFDSIGDGALTLHFRSKPTSDDFQKYLDSREPHKDPNNTWFQELRANYNCSWDNETENSCESLLQAEVITGTIGYYSIQGMLVLGQALDTVIRTYCPDVNSHSPELRKCVTGQRILSVLKSRTFEVDDTVYEFDENGDLVGGYSIRQYNSTTQSFTDTVGEWDSDEQGLRIFWDRINWSPFKESGGTNGTSHPESVCSYPCGEGEYYILRELRCCWVCYKCRENEILNEDRTDCGVCPDYHWPETEDTCAPIEPTYWRWKDKSGIALAFLAVAGIILTVVVTVLFIRHRKNRLIKMTSREMSGIILVGILLAFLTMFAVLYPPTNISCILSNYGFAFSVCLIYGPLLVKTTRIFRIFDSGKKGIQKPSFIGRRAQLVFCIIIIVIQLSQVELSRPMQVTVIISTINGVMAPVVAKLRMPSPTTKFVEQYCDLQVQSMMGYLSFNLLLILGCGILGFLTRKLPQNFNESWFIFVSVSTTIFVWVAFLPTYFTSFYASNQALLLALCLMLNAGVTLLCQFVPKVYAIYFVDEEKLVFSTTGTAPSMIQPSLASTSETHAAGAMKVNRLTVAPVGSQNAH